MARHYRLSVVTRTAPAFVWKTLDQAIEEALGWASTEEDQAKFKTLCQAIAALQDERGKLKIADHGLAEYTLLVEDER